MPQTHIIYGLHAVQAALEKEPESIEQLWLEHNRRNAKGQQLIKLAKQANIAVERVGRDELDRLTEQQRHQGVVARSTQVSVKDEAALKTLLQALDEAPFLLILDGVQDPHNLGACLRTADAAGVHALIAPRDRACGLTSTVRKVACGAAETVPFIQVTNLARTLRGLKESGIWLIGADAQASSSLYQADLRGPVALVLGAEGQGLRRLTQEHCDLQVKLPMQGYVQSLNVSVVAGICLYEALRQRTQ